MHVQLNCPAVLLLSLQVYRGDMGQLGRVAVKVALSSTSGTRDSSLDKEWQVRLGRLLLGHHMLMAMVALLGKARSHACLPFRPPARLRLGHTTVALLVPYPRT